MCGPFLITHGRFPCDLCERRAHHAISPPTTSLLRQVIDLPPVHRRFSTIAARSPLRRAGTLAVSQLRVLNSRTLFLACLHFQPPHGVTRNSILILITPGDMVLDHPLFVGSFARCSMAGVGKSGCAGGLLDGLKGGTVRPDLTIPPDKEFLVEPRMAVSQRGLWMGFMRSAERFPERPAVIVHGTSLSYRQLRETAIRIAASIQAHQEDSWTPLTAVFAQRSATAFTGVLGALLAGNGYVPLNRTFPVTRTRLMFQRSQCRSIIVDAEFLPQLDALLDGDNGKLLLVAPDLEDPRCYRERWPQHIFLGSGDLEEYAAWREPTPDGDAIAYLLFTSGSTGAPRIMVAHRNVISFVDYIADRLEVTERDIVSQMFDLTFDLSAFDMFVSWERGACVCCPSQKTLINPVQFIRGDGLTIWFSVPSTVSLMKQMGLLKPGAFPSLRLSLFCGEPLPVSCADAWLRAAPNSILENLYGPTELTIACTSYRWES